MERIRVVRTQMPRYVNSLSASCTTIIISQYVELHCLVEEGIDAGSVLERNSSRLREELERKVDQEPQAVVVNLNAVDLGQRHSYNSATQTLDYEAEEPEKPQGPENPHSCIY